MAGPPSPRRAVGALVVAVALVAGACSDGSGGDASSTTARPPVTTGVLAGDVVGADLPADVADPIFEGHGDPRIDVSAYDVTLRADPGKDQVAGTVTLTLRPTTTKPLDRFTLDLRGPEVGRVTVDGIDAEVDPGDAQFTVRPARPLVPGTDAKVTVDYGGVPDQTPDAVLGVPVGWQADDHGGWFTMSEPDGTSTWVPCNDHPSDKAAWTIRLDTPADATGVAIGRLDGPPAEADGRKQWRWVETEPVAPYLVLAAVGDYDLVTRPVAGLDGVTATFAFPPDLSARRRAGFDPTDDILSFFTDRFGPYPDDDAGAIVVDHDLGLALEVQTRPLFGTDSVDGATVWPLAHELAHQWFGDSVTPASWADLWLNEGFATYADWLWRDHAGIESLDQQVADTAAARADDGLAVRDPVAASTFDLVLYEGGALALHALRQTVGDDAFFAILRRWARDEAGRSVTTQDFIDLAEAETNRNLDAFFHAWLDEAPQPAMPG